MGISTAETRPAATAAARHAAARHVAAWQITTAAAGLLAGAGVAWVVSHPGGDSCGIPKHPFAVPVRRCPVPPETVASAMHQCWPAP